MNLSQSDLTRYWSKVEKTETCWLWTGYVRKSGYGTFRLGNRTTEAHRASYLIANGHEPEGLDVDHLCRVRHCVNPDHLEAVSHRVNLLRGETVSGKNAAKTHCIHGHPFDEANTYWIGRWRKCRACAKEAQARFHARRRARMDATAT